MSGRLAPGLTELHCHATGPDRSHATFAPPCTHTREYPDSLTTFCTHAFCIGIAVEASEPRQLATATQVQGCPAVELEHPESLLVPFTVPSSSVPVLSEMRHWSSSGRRIGPVSDFPVPAAAMCIAQHSMAWPKEAKLAETYYAALKIASERKG
ncbi:hypothetical protein NDA14_006312 [Ustilago hordei]|nr:hypothetical protein NDA10_006952 [Ustilago hordei]KAJ1599974.1 hypothetical protein NDA14_006312 [Ustilago hordei]UTT92555.1 hypothetical protein NDA17_002316 [Ustilago hordei]